MNEEQVRMLKDAINEYNYPCVTYDFKRNEKVCHPNMLSVERATRRQLLSGDVDEVKDGLSNVLYWGYASQPGRQRKKVHNFRHPHVFRGKPKTGVTTEQLKDVMELINDINLLQPPTINQKAIKELPEFGLAFATKLLMFLDPNRFVVLDAQLGKLHDEHPHAIFTNLSRRKGDGYLSMSRANIGVYNDWCRLCERIAAHPELLQVRAVDVERGIYQMVKDGELREAVGILASA